MLIPTHDKDHGTTLQPVSLVGESWTTEVVPRLPADLAVQARTHKAFPRVRGIATPADLLRGLLAYVLGPLSTRRLGAWAVLMGVAEISETAWRKRLRASSAWLQWLLSEVMATPEEPELALPRPLGRVLLVDASRLRQPGGTGDDWRLHLAYDLLAGRMSQVSVTDRHGGEHLERYRGQAGDVLVADGGYGYRRSVAWAAEQQADVVVRIHPATFPLESEAGQPCNVWRWLRQKGPKERQWVGWCRWQGQRYRVRLIAAKLEAAATQRARRRHRRKAQKAGRTVGAATLAVAGWVLLITTLAEATWAVADVLALYRARWQVELVFKKMKQLLRLNQIRSTHPQSVEATVRALLLAWALHEDTTTVLRPLLRATATTELVVVSSWLLSGLGLDTLRQQVQGRWSEARLQACLPRLRRFLCSHPRRRVHQESTVRAWLEQRSRAGPGGQRQAA
jgi:hypothetical protein